MGADDTLSATGRMRRRQSASLLCQLRPGMDPDVFPAADRKYPHQDDA